MAAAGRRGDRSKCPHDAHGCSSCPHDVGGPAVLGSANVLINGKPALREGDQGAHGSCCGPQTWVTRAGAPRVLINNRRAHRKGDPVVHCGGAGALIEGSVNVLIGDYRADKEPPRSYWLNIAAIDDKGVPIPYRPIRLERPGREPVEVVTDYRGFCRVMFDDEEEEVIASLPEVEATSIHDL